MSNPPANNARHTLSDAWSETHGGKACERGSTGAWCHAIRVSSEGRGVAVTGVVACSRAGREGRGQGARRVDAHDTRSTGASHGARWLEIDVSTVLPRRYIDSRGPRPTPGVPPQFKSASTIGTSPGQILALSRPAVVFRPEAATTKLRPSRQHRQADHGSPEQSSDKGDESGDRLACH